MKTLAFEFSSPVRTVAVLSPAAEGGEPAVLGHASDEGGRTVTPLMMVELALARAGIEREAVEGLVIGLGPGSYTGVRSAVALAQGWQLGRPVRILGLGSADGLAAAAQSRGWFGRIGVVIDAQRDEFYFSGYEVGQSGWSRTEALRIASKREIPTLISDYPTMAGPEVTKFFADGQTLFPDAAELGRLAWGRTDFTPAEKLEPIYLRETKFVKAPPSRIVPGLKLPPWSRVR